MITLLALVAMFVGCASDPATSKTMGMKHVLVSVYHDNEQVCDKYPNGTYEHCYYNLNSTQNQQLHSMIENVITDTELLDIYTKVNEAFLDASYGKFGFEKMTIVRLGGARAQPTASDFNGQHFSARTYTLASGVTATHNVTNYAEWISDFDFINYWRFLSVGKDFKASDHFTGVYQAILGFEKGDIYMLYPKYEYPLQADSTPFTSLKYEHIVIHEFGHAFGFTGHAWYNRWEYEDKYDIMGRGNIEYKWDSMYNLVGIAYVYDVSFSLIGRYLFGWVDESHVATQSKETQHATYKIHAFDDVNAMNQTDAILGVRLDTQATKRTDALILVDSLDQCDNGRLYGYACVLESDITNRQWYNSQFYSLNDIHNSIHLWIQYRHANEDSKKGASLMIASSGDDPINTALLHPQGKDKPIETAFLEEGETFVYSPETPTAIVIYVSEVNEAEKYIIVDVTYVDGEKAFSNGLTTNCSKASWLCSVHSSVVKEAVCGDPVDSAPDEEAIFQKLELGTREDLVGALSKVDNLGELVPLWDCERARAIHDTCSVPLKDLVDVQCDI